MADTKISALTAATTLAGTEVLPVVQSGSTKKATVDQVLAAAPTTTNTHLTSNGNEGTGKDLLVRFLIPENTLAVNGDRLELEIAGAIAGHVSNTYGMYIDFGGESLFNPGSGANLPHPQGGYFNIEASIMRKSATSVACSVVGVIPPIETGVFSIADPPFIFCVYDDATTVDLSTGLNLDFSAEGVVDNDVVAQFATCTKYPA